MYEGTDAGASCPGFESITVDPGTAVTYCFTVTNTGNTYLADVEVNDPDLDIGLSELLQLSGDPDLLAPATASPGTSK